ncbi:MAG: pyridoxamine kinase [Dysgonamonadaceae bacterium]|jgi:pyridoxine kinase|nr:pyridoxamine kinase [Dysgonamonadaceae bacterium]
MRSIRQKRVAAIHDISGFGRCSLTVALPIISSSGVETVVMPTAVLSTHTGGFTGYTYRDLTDDMRPVTQHWKSLNLNFDAIYTGFLGSFEQQDIVVEFFENFKNENNLVIVDPVMADNGELYKIFTPEFAVGMRKVCKKADIIIPNLTEASLLVGERYNPGPYTEDYIEDILRKLAALGPDRIVLTGVFFDDVHLGAASYINSTDEISYAFSKRVPGYFHGTGDVFGSALISALMNDFDLHQATEIAVRFTTKSIQRTAEAETDVRFGVNFEQTIPDFLKDLNLV